ncbi:MAG: ogr/Delta-like zinc finger family protein [Sphingomonas pseudosanguinis]|uniref:ogr/Delta-like zinc finger family protein n=1 Tax=Sphingomonas pseudosanguinis TaxID=413712 RepID=UPI00391A024E
MKKKLVRIPGIACPHCGSRAITRDSVEIDVLTRELRCVCDNDACGHTMVVQLAVIRSIRPSDVPNPAVRLPFGQWRARPANDDEKVPVNDNRPEAAESAPPG